MSSCCAIACGGLVGCNQFGCVGGCPERVPPVCVACAGNSVEKGEEEPNIYEVEGR